MAFRQVVLMYHSVSGPAAPAVVGSFPIPLERFKYQIQEARRRGWQVGRLSDLRKPVSANTLYITGDDGTVDWARNVLPWCEENGIWTHTALITGPWLDEPIYPVAHRLQILLSLPARELLGAPDTDEVALLTARFARAEDYRGLRFAEFGVHTVTHRAFGGDAEKYMAEEVLPCAKAIRDAGLPLSRYFTLPMRPRYPATVEQLVPALRAAGFEGVLDGAGEWDRQSFVVPRIDAKNIELFFELPPWTEGYADESDCLARHEVPR